MMSHSLDTISLRLLRLFETVHRTRSISQAAEALRTSQPSVSVSLNRLRQLFDDPLFVRVGSRMEPTPRADELVEGVRAMLLIAGDHFVGRAPFDPARSDRRFTLHMTDPGETILMPRLVNRLAQVAPAVRLRVRRIGDDSQAMLAGGEADLVVGYLSREAEGLRQRKLHDERYVCIARADHPRIGDTLDIDRFTSERHVVAAIAGTGHAHVEPGFGQLKVGGNVALELSSYAAVGALVARTELIAVVPARLGAELAARGDIRAFDLPLESPVYQVRQYWHPRSDHDAGHRWMRDLLVALVNAHPASGKKRGAPPGPASQVVGSELR
jgi:DNA-binding transcriptional LysR family regulator